MSRDISLRTSICGFVWALLFCCPAFALAQQTGVTFAAIGGRVTDPQGAGVAGAVVTLYARARPRARAATVTDGTGSYRFERLAAPGEYIVEVEAAGFAHRVATVKHARRGEEVTLHVLLEVAGVSTEVVVTASDSPQPVDEAAKAITVVGRGEIDARDEFLIAEAVRTIPGLRVQQLGGPGRLTSIRARGLRNQDTAILIDGLRFRDAASITGDALSFIGDLAVTNVSSVEVLRGSGSSLYGTNAIGGVINIITDAGGGPVRGSLLAEGGGANFFRGRAQIAGGSGLADRFVYSLGVTHINVGEGQRAEQRQQGRARNTSGQGRGQFRLTPSTTLSARVYAGDAFIELNSSPLSIGGALPATGIVDAVALAPAETARFAAGTPVADLKSGAATFIPDVRDPDASQATRFFSGALVLTGRPTEQFGYTVTYHALATDRITRNGPAGVGFQPFGGTGLTRTDFDGRIQTFNARTDFRLGRFNHITAGYEFERDNYLNRSIPTDVANTSTVDAVQRSHTFFAQDQLRFLDDRLQLSAAFRAQFFTLRRPAFTGSSTQPYRTIELGDPPAAYTGDGSIAYLLRSSGTKLRAHVGNGYRAPSLFERFGTTFFGGAFTILGEPGLRPERSIAFDAGLDQSFYRDRVRASATFFYTRLQEVIDFGPVGPLGGLLARPFGGYINRGGGLARGAEFSVAATPARTLELFAAYTYTNSDNQRPVAGILASFIVPDHQFSLVATQRVTKRLLVNLDLTAAGTYLAPLGFPTRVYRFDRIVRADLGASYTLPLSERRSLRFFGKVNNLLDREYYENGFNGPGRAWVAGAAFNY